jgi:hypothetical protein
MGLFRTVQIVPPRPLVPMRSLTQVSAALLSSAANPKQVRTAFVSRVIHFPATWRAAQPRDVSGIAWPPVSFMEGAS